MKISRRFPWFVASLAVAWSGLAWSQPVRAAEKAIEQEARRLQLQLARETLNQQVRNRQDEKLGKIEELAVDYNRGVVAYAVMDVGGFLGIGGKYVAVPWGALNITQKDNDGKKEIHIALDADKQRLKDAPGSFDKDTWPNMVEMQWGRDVHRYYSINPYWEMERERLTRGREALKGEPISPQSENEKARTEISTRKLYKAEAEMLGRPVKNAAKEVLGEVHDLMIDESTGEIAFVVVKFSDARYLADKDKPFAAIPFSLVDFRLEGEKEKQKGEFFITLNSEQIKPQMFGKDRWPSLSDRGWAVTVYRHYEVQPYWEAKRITIREKTTVVEPAAPGEPAK